MPEFECLYYEKAFIWMATPVEYWIKYFVPAKPLALVAEFVRCFVLHHLG